MMHLRVSLLILLAAAAPALAQTSPPPGILRLPSKTSSAPAPDPVVTAQPAPLTPVQQVAPFTTPQVHPPLAAPPPGSDPLLLPNGKPAAKPAKADKTKTAAAKPAAAKPAPVIQAPGNVHAQRPTGPEAAKAAPPTAVPITAPPPNPAAPPPPKVPDNVGTVTGNPLPRWAALRSDEVNLRVGPGTRFPIQWQYHRRDLPVLILRENEVWRLIQDQDGVKGWVHQATLVGHRGFVVKVPEATLRHGASDDSSPVAHLKAGVVGRLRACEAVSAWCEVQAGDYKGWLRRDQFYGTNPGEAVGN